MELLFVIGNLGSDAEARKENGNEFIRFNVAETRKWTGADNVTHEETIWNSCVMSGANTKLLPYLVKGAKVCVIGRASTRVYSSPKERRMVAGINISVDRLELIGQTPDAVPREVISADGQILKVQKFFAIHPDIAKNLVGKLGETATLYDKQGNPSFVVDYNGFVSKVDSPAVGAQQEQSANSDNVEPEIY